MASFSHKKSKSVCKLPCMTNHFFPFKAYPMFLMGTQDVKDGENVFTLDTRTYFEIKIKSCIKEGFQERCEDVIS